MPRLYILEVIVFLSAFGVSYLLRLILGRAIRGPAVALWGILFGLLGAVLGSYVVENALQGTRFLWTDDNIWGVLAIAFRYFFLTAIAGGFLGAIVASLPRGKRHDSSRNPKQPPPSK